LLDESVYVASYNPANKVPNWVSWNLNRSYLGHLPRRNDFRADTLLPSNFPRVTPEEYRQSGYDRGHMCPSADREDSPEHNGATFLMTNIMPQLHELNAGPWEQLEERERELAKRPGTELFIIAGGVFANPPPTIGHGVAVPKANYKIIVVLNGGRSAADVTPDTEVIATIMPNERAAGMHPWTDYVTSVDEIERQSGYDFLSKVPEDVQRVIEARVAGVQ
jgi:endonuclease G